MKELEKDILEETIALEETSVVELPEKIDLVDLIDQPAWKTILIELVKKEKMNPWEIDINELTKKYLEKINSLSYHNLKIPANAILACALLLKFKSNFLRVSEIKTKEDLEKEKKKMTPEEIKEFEAMLPDLTNIRKIREGKISLDELVSAIEKMLKQTKKIEEKSKEKKQRIKFVIPYQDFKIEEEMEKTLKRIKRNVDSQNIVVFSRVIKDPTKIEDVVKTFIACLFLMNKGQIIIWQKEFFGEIFISLLEKTENQNS
ncbi:MAG: segregation/condensation protein A [Candidatus Diapherotrites archaeon]